MTCKWRPTQSQQIGPILRVFNFFCDELSELQDELNCPDEFINEFLDEIGKRWSPDSCHSIVRNSNKNSS